MILELSGYTKDIIFAWKNSIYIFDSSYTMLWPEKLLSRRMTCCFYPFIYILNNMTYLYYVRLYIVWYGNRLTSQRDLRSSILLCCCSI